MSILRNAPILLAALVAAPALATTPSADTDFDGVADVADAFPCDWRRSAVSFVPSEGELGTLLFEDNWPSQGDLDLNDAVVAYQYAVFLGADGRATGLRLTVVPRALGADLRNGLALHLALPASALSRATLARGGGAATPLASSPGEAEIDLVLAPDLRALFGDATGFINTMPSAGTNPGDAAPLVLELEFRAPVALAVAGDPFDLYFFRSADRGHQVHRPKFGGTASMNVALFGTADDGSSGARRFVDRDGLPFILDVPALSVWPREQVRVEAVWPSITRFARTGGAEAADYYAESTRDTFFVPASKPQVTAPDYAQCLAPTCADGARNGLETDVDCGADCAACAAGATCRAHTDCASGACSGSTCLAQASRACTVEHGVGAEVPDGLGWGPCQPTQCDPGYRVVGVLCVPETRACAVPNGIGTQTWTGADYGPCSLERCEDGYRAVSGSCVLVTYAWTSGAWGACGSGSASPSYGAWGACQGGTGAWVYGAWGACSAAAACSGNGTQSRGATCDFAPASGAQTRAGACAWAVGSGTQTRTVVCMSNFGDEAPASACGAAAPQAAQSCTPVGTPSSCGALVTAQACTPTDTSVCGAAATSQACSSPAGSRSCAVTNGTGTQSCAAGSTTWSACTLVSCNVGFHVESGACVSDTRSCTFANGTGTESWTGSAWSGTCTLASCNAGFHAESGACVSNTRSCAVANGAGTQTWTGSAYGACTVSSCNTGFHVESGACVANTRSCTLANGGGVQYWAGSAWGACLALTCAGLVDGSPCQDTDACSTGETCRAGACVGSSAITYAVIESPGMNFPGNTWTSPAWNNTRMASGISLSGTNIYFGSTGVYRVTLSYRHGNGPDVWTAVRLFGGSVRGTSAGYGNTGSYNPNLFTTSFLASVEDTSIPYQVQLGRLTSGVTVDTTGATIGTDALPSIQATLQKISELSGGEPYMQAQGGAYTAAANAWTDVSFSSGAPLASGITMPTASQFSFTTPGVYRVTLSWRFGTGADVWSGVRLQGDRDTAGTSAAFANPGSNPNLYTADFLATVRDVSQNYRIQVGRLNAAMAVDGVVLAIAGFTPPRVQATLQRVGELPGAGVPLRAYAQLEGQTQTAAANGWTGIRFDRASVASGIGLSGANLTFPRAGVYRVSLSYRLGNGTDVWTAVRLHDGQATRGISAGFGNFADTQALFTSTFLARVVDPSRTHQIQLGRLNNAQILWTGPTVVGTELPGVVATIEEVQTLGCSDGSACTVDTCDASLGCQNTALPTGSTCEAGSRCAADTCQAGGCVVGPAESCDDGNPCTAELCSAASGCSSVAVANGVACSDGSANTTGDSCQNAVCVGTTVTPHAVFEAGTTNFPANAWTSATWTSTRFSQGVSASGANLTFPSAGVYRISMTWRFGAGPDVWTAVRLFGDGASRGISAGFGNSATNNPSPTEVSFLARIDNPAATYQIQLGRLTSALSMNATPLEIAGMTPAALQASVTRVGDLPGGAARYAQLEGPIMTFAANGWTSAAWTNVPVSSGVSVSGSNISFNQTGVYRVTLSWRFGNGGDVWTAIRLFGGSRTVGTSAGFGNSGYQPNLFTASFLANVDDVSVPYAIQMGRLTSANQLDVVPGTIAGQAPPALQATLERVGDLPSAASSARTYAQFEAAQQSFTGSYWSPVFFSGTTFASGISANSRFIRFSRPGTYRVSIGYRLGTGDDVWTGIRLQGATTVGQSAAVGNITNTSNLVTMSFLARVTDANRNYELQIGRLVGPLTVNATPLPIGGVQTPAISVSMEEL